jgi:hypothetical protein
MLINEIPYEKEKSDNITNYIPLGDNGRARYHHVPQFWEAWYMREYHMVKHPDLSSKQIFKKVFGRQLTCVVYMHRNWIWTFSNSTDVSSALFATIYCLINIRGVYWEMNIDSNKLEIIKLREEIEKALIA